jgi:hypothetical protein
MIGRFECANVLLSVEVGSVQIRRRAVGIDDGDRQLAELRRRDLRWTERSGEESARPCSATGESSIVRNTPRTRSRRAAGRLRSGRSHGRGTRVGLIRSAAPRGHWRELSIAPHTSGEAQTFRVTHPFHPLRGRTFQFVDCRQTWGEDRVYFYDDSGHLARLLLQWTDVVPTGNSIRVGRVPDGLLLMSPTRDLKTWNPAVRPR